MDRSTLPPLEDDFSRALLGSAHADGPSNAAYTKVAAALGVGIGLGVGVSLPAPAALAAGAAGVAGIARWSSSLGAKLLALGVSGGLLVGSGVFLFSGSRPNKPATTIAQTPALPAALATGEPGRAAGHAHSSVRAPSAVPPVLPSARAIPVEQTSASNPGRAPTLPARRTGHASPAPASPTRAGATRAATGSSLAEQVQSLDRARVALGSGDSSSALREIARYRAAWPDGVFLTEASVLEVEALAARGERSLAATRAADFVAAHPDSPQADRLRALVPAKKR